MLLIFWFYNYSQSVQSQDVLYGPQENLLYQIATLASESYASNVTITFTAPCLANTTFWIYGGTDNGDGTATNGGSLISLYAQLKGTRQNIATKFPAGTSQAGLTGYPLAFTCDYAAGNSGKIKFERKTLPGTLINGVLISKG